MKFVILVGLLVAGCAISPPFHRVGTTDSRVASDYAECRIQAPEKIEGLDLISSKLSWINTCMTQKGYYRDFVFGNWMW